MIFQGGSAGASESDECYVEWLRLADAIHFIARGWGREGSCTFLESDAILEFPRGAVVLDNQGRIVEVLGATELRTEDLDSEGLADQQYPCYAGETVKFDCFTYS